MIKKLILIFISLSFIIRFIYINSDEYKIKESYNFIINNPFLYRDYINKLYKEHKAMLEACINDVSCPMIEKDIKHDKGSKYIRDKYTTDEAFNEFAKIKRKKLQDSIIKSYKDDVLSNYFIDIVVHKRIKESDF